MNFCSECGAPVTLRIPPGDNRPRHVCDVCEAIHYQNPKLVAGCVPRWGDDVLLCRRGIEPRRGLWTLPAGFMENGESTAEAAARETLEEANARVAMGEMLCYLDIPRINQVHVIYLADLLDTDFSPGDESLEVGLFAEADIPWSELAFRSIEISLRRFYEDRKEGRFRTHFEDIHHQPRRAR